MSIPSAPLLAALTMTGFLLSAGPAVSTTLTAPCLPSTHAPCPTSILIVEEDVRFGTFTPAPDGASIVVYKVVQVAQARYLSLSKLDETMSPEWSTEIRPTMAPVPIALTFVDGGSSIVISWTQVGTDWFEAWIAKYSMSDGSELWSKRVGYWLTSAKLSTSPDGLTIFAVGEDYTRINNPNLYITAINSLDGHVKWNHIYDGRGRDWPGLYGPSQDLAATILASQNGALVYVAAQVNGHVQESTDALVLALDARTGAIAWEFRHRPADNFLGVRLARSNGAYDLVDLPGENRIVAMTSTGLFALSSENGEEIWRQPWLGNGCPWNRPLDKPGMCTLFADQPNDRLYAFTPSHLAAYSSRDGTLLWIIPAYETLNDRTLTGHALLSKDADFLQVVRETRTPEPGAEKQDLVVTQINSADGRIEWSTRLDFGSYEFSAGIVESNDLIHVLGFSFHPYYFIASYDIAPNAIDA